MERMGRTATNLSRSAIPRSAIPMLVIATALIMGGCGGDTGSNTRVAPSVDPGGGELGVPPADSALVGPVRRYGAEVPVAYYDLSFTLSKRTGGITPPVQARIFAYMGLALYESLVAGMPRHRSIARH